MTTITPLSLPKAIPGFTGITAAELVRGSGPVMALRVGDRSLPVTVPWNVNPEFGYHFQDEDVVELGDSSDWYLVCVVNLPKRTVNQFAPIVINERLGVAAQIINQVSAYSTRDPIRL